MTGAASGGAGAMSEVKVRVFNLPGIASFFNYSG